MTLKLARLVTACGRLAEMRDRRERGHDSGDGDGFSVDELDAVLDEIVAARLAIDAPKEGASS